MMDSILEVHLQEYLTLAMRDWLPTIAPTTQPVVIVADSWKPIGADLSQHDAASTNSEGKKHETSAFCAGTSPSTGTAPSLPAPPVTSRMEMQECLALVFSRWTTSTSNTTALLSNSGLGQPLKAPEVNSELEFGNSGSSMVVVKYDAARGVWSTRINAVGEISLLTESDQNVTAAVTMSAGRFPHAFIASGWYTIDNVSFRLLPAQPVPSSNTQQQQVLHCVNVADASYSTLRACRCGTWPLVMPPRGATVAQLTEELALVATQQHLQRSDTANSSSNTMITPTHTAAAAAAAAALNSTPLSSFSCGGGGTGHWDSGWATNTSIFYPFSAAFMSRCQAEWAVSAEHNTVELLEYVRRITDEALSRPNGDENGGGHGDDGLNSTVAAVREASSQRVDDDLDVVDATEIEVEQSLEGNPGGDLRQHPVMALGLSGVASSKNSSSNVVPTLWSPLMESPYSVVQIPAVPLHAIPSVADAIVSLFTGRILHPGRVRALSMHVSSLSAMALLVDVLSADDQHLESALDIVEVFTSNAAGCGGGTAPCISADSWNYLMDFCGRRPLGISHLFVRSDTPEGADVQLLFNVGRVNPQLNLVLGGSHTWRAVDTSTVHRGAASPGGPPGPAGSGTRDSIASSSVRSMNSTTGVASSSRGMHHHRGMHLAVTEPPSSPQLGTPSSSCRMSHRDEAVSATIMPCSTFPVQPTLLHDSASPTGFLADAAKGRTYAVPAAYSVASPALPPHVAHWTSVMPSMPKVTPLPAAKLDRFGLLSPTGFIEADFPAFKLLSGTVATVHKAVNISSNGRWARLVKHDPAPQTPHEPLPQCVQGTESASAIAHQLVVFYVQYCPTLVFGVDASTRSVPVMTAGLPFDVQYHGCGTGTSSSSTLGDGVQCSRQTTGSGGGGIPRNKQLETYLTAREASARQKLASQEYWIDAAGEAFLLVVRSAVVPDSAATLSAVVHGWESLALEIVTVASFLRIASLQLIMRSYVVRLRQHGM